MGMRIIKLGHKNGFLLRDEICQTLENLEKSIVGVAWPFQERSWKQATWIKRRRRGHDGYSQGKSF